MSAGLPQVVWDGKDMAAVQMLTCDLREQGEPAAIWGRWRDAPVLALRRRPGGSHREVETGQTVIRYGSTLVTAHLGDDDRDN